MRKADIKVGTEYVFSRYNDYGIYPSSASKVTVTSEPFSLKDGYYPYTRKTYVEVLRANGDADKVQTRHIREEWAPYVANRDRVKAIRKAQDAEVLKAQTERAEILSGILAGLRASGVKDTGSYVYRSVELDLIRRFAPGILVGGDNRIECPLAGSVGGYISSDEPFKVKAADLVTILL